MVNGALTPTRKGWAIRPRNDIRVCMGRHAEHQRRRGCFIPGRVLVAALFLWFGLNQLLLWGFLGFGSPLLIAGNAALVLALAAIAYRATGALPPVPVLRMALLFGFALTIYALGGEGRFFYANIDWQVRDAVLRDMALGSWPFVYVTGAAQPDLLRAPIGFFLAPALAAKAWGFRAGDIVLLLQNAALLAILLGLGSSLLERGRQRLAALGIVTLFSGLDIILQLIVKGRPEDHLEFAFDWMQYSSHITQAFWVPQHAFAGWLGALLFLLWHRGLMPLWPMLALLPLTALWSPLPLIGMMPFVVWAGLSALRRGELRPIDFALPALAVLLALPTLLYLSAAPDAVGVRLLTIPIAPWLLFQALEVLVWLVPLLLWWKHPLRGPLLLAGAILLALPFVQVGWSIDLMMRASIPSLAILSAAVAMALTEDGPAKLKLWLCAALLLGSATGLSEVRRALAEPPSPRGQCSFYGAWDVSFAAYPKGSHLAPLDRVPAVIRPNDPARVEVNDPRPCWQERWLRPSGV